MAAATTHHGYEAQLYEKLRETTGLTERELTAGALLIKTQQSIRSAAQRENTITTLDDALTALSRRIIVANKWGQPHTRPVLQLENILAAQNVPLERLDYQMEEVQYLSQKHFPIEQMTTTSFMTHIPPIETLYKMKQLCERFGGPERVEGIPSSDNFENYLRELTRIMRGIAKSYRPGRRSDPNTIDTGEGVEATGESFGLGGYSTGWPPERKQRGR